MNFANALHQLDLVVFAVFFCLIVWLIATIVPVSKLRNAGISCLAAALLGGALIFLLLVIVAERVSDLIRVFERWLASRLGPILSAFDRTCKVFLFVACFYLGSCTYWAWKTGAIERATDRVIDTSAPAPLVPCSAYYAASGDSITMSDQGYAYVWVGTHDIHRAPEVFQCSTELGQLQAAR